MATAKCGLTNVECVHLLQTAGWFLEQKPLCVHNLPGHTASARTCTSGNGSSKCETEDTNLGRLNRQKKEASSGKTSN